MRTFLVLAVFITAWALGSGPASAREAPWCAVYSQGRGAVYWDCQYGTFEACYPNIIGGNRGFCNLNPRFEGYATAPKARMKRHVRANVRKKHPVRQY